MNYAFTSFTAPAATLADLLALGQRYGYAGIEPRTGAGHRHGVELTATPAERRAMRVEAAARGVTLCCLASPCWYTDPATAATQVETTRRTIDLAADLGAPLVRVFAGVIPPGMSRAEAIDRVAAAVGSVAEQAAARGVAVCLETHDDWSDPTRLAAVLRRVDHPAVGIVWDVMHPVRDGGSTIDGAFTLLRPWVRHVHIHDGSARRDRRRFTAIGRGDLDHRRVVALLDDARYGGFLSGEWLADWMSGWPPPEVYLPRELATMRNYERELTGAGTMTNGET